MMIGFLSIASAARADVIRSGSWQKVTYEIKGGWKIVDADGKRFVELSTDFEVQRAPDLKIFLSPLAPDKLTRNTVTRDAVLVGKLASFKGALRFELPGSVDLRRFKSIVLHCEKYSVIFADSAL